MSNRTRLHAARTEAAGLASDLRVLAVQINCAPALVRVQRASHLLAAAAAELTEALVSPVDPIVEHRPC